MPTVMSSTCQLRGKEKRPPGPKHPGRPPFLKPCPGRAARQGCCFRPCVSGICPGQEVGCPGFSEALGHCCPSEVYLALRVICSVMGLGLL